VNRADNPKRFVLLVFAATLVAGCAGLAPPPVSDNAAVLTLIDSARADTAAGRTDSAAAAVERALRIEPKNPRLWRELAQLRFTQAEYAQAEGFAARSNSWAGSDHAFKAANWRLIAEARERRGDRSGALAALARAAELER